MVSCRSRSTPINTTTLDAASAAPQTPPPPPGNCALRVCYCWEGFTGADCSLRTCPRDHAWSDRAASSDNAHNPAECSNMGTCNRQTGQCSCRKGFEGRACSRLSCPNDCSKHGVCQDMSHFASVKDPGEGTVFAYDHAWDSDMIFGW